LAGFQQFLEFCPEKQRLQFSGTVFPHSLMSLSLKFGLKELLIHVIAANWAWSSLHETRKRTFASKPDLDLQRFVE
jgi:hypothetical protein